MLDELKQMLSHLRDTDTFKSWGKNHKSAFLSSCFIIDNQGWQLAFYSPENNKISTFLKDSIIQSDSAVFKQSAENVEELNLDDVKIDMEKALDIGEAELSSKHPGYKPVKKIIVLQKIGSTIWNITFLTTSFYIYNIKIDASNGKVIFDDFVSSLYMNPKKDQKLY